MSDGKPIFRVLVRQPDRIEGASVVTPYRYMEVTEAQYLAHLAGDSNWRAAKAAPSSWFGRGWRRLSGGDA